MTPSRFDAPYTPNPLYHFPSELWTYRRVVGWDDSPHLKTPDKLRQRDNLIKEYGLNSQFVQSMVFGRFAFSKDENNIFMERHVQLLIEAMSGNSKPLPGDVRAAGDVSGGKDKMVLMIREGTEVLLIDKAQAGTDIEMAERWVSILNDLKIQPHQFWVDGGGIGSTVANYMELRLGYAGINRFMSNNNPTYDFQFADYYTEIHYWLKELLMFQALKVPWNQELINQVRDRLYVISGTDSKIKTQPKKAYREAHSGKSPDELDTLVYLFADLNMDAIRRGQAVFTPTANTPKTDAPTKFEIDASRQMVGAGPFADLRRLPAFKLRLRRDSR